jgi:predicted nucleic acid-binding protein
VALINRRDAYHAPATALAVELEGQPLVVTDAVLLEIGNALARSFKAQAVEVMESFLESPEVEIVRLTPEIFEQSFALYK